MTWYQEWFGEEYIELYSHRDDEEARRQIDFLQQRVGAINGPLLDLACGGGRHSAEMIERGYRAVGCDLSYVLLRTALRDYSLVRVARADMRDLPFGDGTFAGLVNFFTSFGYFDEEHENLRVIGEMSRVLRKGAPFLFDYLNVHRDAGRLVPHEERETEAGTVVIHRWFDAAERTINKRITIGPKRFLERVRAYDLGEISGMFRQWDLAIQTVCGDFDGSAYEQESPRLIVIGRKE